MLMKLKLMLLIRVCDEERYALHVDHMDHM